MKGEWRTARVGDVEYMAGRNLEKIAAPVALTGRRSIVEIDRGVLWDG